MRGRETGSRRTGRAARSAFAAFAVAVTAAALTAAALAGDDISADGDAVAAGSNNPVALGTVAPGATVSRAVRFTLECKTQQHVDAGDTVSLTYSASNSSIPAGGSVSAGAGSIVRPSGWPTDGTTCASPAQTASSGGVGTGSDGTVTLTAPSAPGSYTYVVQYDIGGTGQSNDISGSNVKITYTLTVADSTPPSITPTVSGALGSNGWYLGNVTVAWTVTDAQSSVSSQTGCGASSVVSDTPGVTFTCSATSAGGTAVNSVTTRRDATIPTVAIDAGVPTSTTTGSLLVTGIAADATSGVASVAVNGQDASFIATSGTFSQIVALACGPNVISATSTDSAGNVSAAVTRTVDYVCDSTPPSIVPTVTGTLGGNDWYTGDVGVAWTVTDGESAVSSQTGCDSSSVVADTAGVTFTCSATSSGGTATESVTVKRDATVPLASASAVSGGSPYVAGTWTREDVVVSYDCSDAMSGVATTAEDDDDTMSAETASGSASGLCLDEAGNSASVSFSPIKIDKTAPSVEFTGAAPAGNASGWHDADVTATFTATDALSGFAPSGSSRSAEVVSSGEGDPVLVESPAFTDLAGNTAAAGAATQGFRIDKTDPSISVSAMSGGSAYSAGTWTNQDVVVSYACSDALSGVVVTADDDDDTVSAESAAGSASGSCFDEAGNSASASFSPIQIDKTAPSMVFIGQSPAKNGYGWNRVNVMLTWSCADGLSGPDSPTSSELIATEGEDQQATGTCSDLAGNAASATDGDVDIDKTRPTLGITGSPTGTAFVVCTLPTRPTFAPADALSGLDGSEGDSWTPAATPSGVGISTYEAHATDRAGNAAVETRSYTTVYGSATVAQVPYLQPVNKDGASRFKLGSTIPVKFQAVCSGSPVATVVARLYVKQGDAQPDPGVDEAFSTSAATSGNLFRWSDGQYIFNLSTKLGHGNPDGTNVAAFSPGTWTLKIGLDDGTWRSVNIQLVK